MRQALTHADCRVRPPGLPVPPALQGSLAGVVFGRLARMNDGQTHQALKKALQQALDGIAPDVLQAWADRAAATLTADVPLTAQALTDCLYLLPGMMLAQGFGAPDHQLRAMGEDALAFVRCIAPGGSDAEIDAGKAAAVRLLAALHAMPPGDLMRGLAEAMARQDLAADEDWLTANAMGLLFQACEGCAGLLGMMLLQMADKADACPHAAMQQVLANTPPIRNTRRFPAAAFRLGDERYAPGEGLVLSLDGEDEQGGLAFGAGPHACPGAAWAQIIALAGWRALRRAGLPAAALRQYRWRRSPNARVPEFY